MESRDIVTALSALAQESRLAVFRLLVKRGPEGFTPSQLSEKLGIPMPTLSFHLKELQNARLIEARREGRSIAYFPSFARLTGVLELLLSECCELADKDCGTACGPLAPQPVKLKKVRA
jgi:ArsR family transcriptional regulator, arsenate/arsenite/antimonite-responsive transcriptional repressor